MVTIARLDPEGRLLQVIVFLTILLTATMVCLSCFDVWNISVAWSLGFGFIFLGLSTFFLSIEKVLLVLITAILCVLFCVVSLIILLGHYFLTHSNLCDTEPSTALNFLAGLLLLIAFAGIFEFFGFAFIYIEKWKKAKRLH